MKIGIISDTHIKNNFSKFKNILINRLNEVDLIIHAGDFNTIEVVNLIKQYNDFIGVYGNNDDENIKKILKKSEMISIDGYKIGITHGHGKTKTTLQRAYDEFKDTDVDIIIFGHSHMPLIKTKNKKLLLNPGSITSKRKERDYSYIVLDLEGKDIKANMIFFK